MEIARRGAGYRDAAAQLGIRIGTVKVHWHHITVKTGRTMLDFQRARPARAHASYLSAECWHEKHGACSGQCPHCGVPCLCRCHQQREVTA